MLLELRHIEKAFDDTAVLRDVSLSLPAGEVLVLLGPSGCGKTTLLRIIAGLETADKGHLLLNDHDLTRLPVHRRGFGMVFQDYALFPHKSVAENVAFGLRMMRWKRPRIDERVRQVLELVGLAGFGRRPIHELSGGEQQRVALARALAPAPRLILLDEPLGSLDRALRERLMLELRHILKEAGSVVGQPEGITAVYVTHDQVEAFAIADRVAVMNNGRIEQIGAPQVLYRNPATPFVARFLGMENLLAGQVTSVKPLVINTALGELAVEKPAGRQAANQGQKVTLLIRPEAGRLLAEGEAEKRNVIHGRLTDLSFRGRYQIATITIEPVHNSQFTIHNSQFTISLNLEFETAVSLPAIGDPITFSLTPPSIVLLESG